MTSYQIALKNWIQLQVAMALCELGIIAVTGYETEYSTLVESYTSLIFDAVKDLSPAVNQKFLDDFGLSINTKIKNHIAEMDRQRYTNAREAKQTQEFKGMVPGPLTQQ